MKRVLKNLLVLAICFPFTNAIQAQLHVRSYEFGAGLGSLVYQGDLSPSRIGSFKTQKPGVEIFVLRIFSPSFSIRGKLVVGALKGDESKYGEPEYRKFRSFSFRSPLTEVSAQLVWSVTGKNNSPKGFSPYVFAGAGLGFLRIRPDWSRIDPVYFDPESSDIYARLAEDTARSLPRVQPVIPLGLGTKYFFSGRWGAYAEASYRLMSTDYLDGFSQAANPERKDSYLGYSVGIIYRTGNKDRLDCPVVPTY